MLNKFSLSTPKEVNKEQYREYDRKRILMLECWGPRKTFISILYCSWRLKIKNVKKNFIYCDSFKFLTAKMNTSMVTQPVLRKIETRLVVSIKIYLMFLLELPDQVFDAVFKSELYSVIMPSFRPYSSGIISCHSVTRPVTCCECFSLCFEAEHATLVSNLNEAFKKL